MADEPARYGVWTTLEGGRNATGPEDIDRLLRRDSRSVFFTVRPGAPALPDDGRASEIAPGTRLRLSGFGRGTTRWSATRTRTTDGFAVQDDPGVAVDLMLAGAVDYIPQESLSPARQIRSLRAARRSGEGGGADLSGIEGLDER